jgi:glyoxylase-like metal-dependent hydrolase (beta-lactamase superfamily II)
VSSGRFPGLGDVRVLPPAMRGPFDAGSQSWLDGVETAPYDAIHELQPSRVMPIPAGRLAVVQGGRRTGVGIPILGYLLDTPAELIVVDTGLSARWRGGGEVHLGPEDSPAPGTPYMPELDGPTLAEQVAEMRLKPDRLICTHLHEDHSSGAAELGLTLEASPAELTRLADPEAEALGYPAAELAGVPTRAVELNPDKPFGPFVASTHLNPDVIAVDTSGHTPGSISLLACLGAAWVLICGDAVYPRMDDPGAPAWRGMLRIARALQDLPGLRVLPGHDTTVLRSAEPGAWLGTPGPPSHSHH